MHADPFSSGRQDVPDGASRTRGSQSGIDGGYRVVVPFGFAPHADPTRYAGTINGIRFQASYAAQHTWEIIIYAC